MVTRRRTGERTSLTMGRNESRLETMVRAAASHGPAACAGPIRYNVLRPQGLPDGGEPCMRRIHVPTLRIDDRNVC